MPWETLSNGIVLLSLENRTEEEQAWAVEISCGAPQVAMRHPAHPAPLSQDKDQADKPKLPALNASNKE
jgi:hypothetical protein